MNIVSYISDVIGQRRFLEKSELLKLLNLTWSSMPSIIIYYVAQTFWNGFVNISSTVLDKDLQ